MTKQIRYTASLLIYFRPIKTISYMARFSEAAIWMIWNSFSASMEKKIQYSITITKNSNNDVWHSQ